jgi:hypothetical protein
VPTDNKINPSGIMPHVYQTETEKLLAEMLNTTACRAKSSTRRIVIAERSEELFWRHVAGRKVSPELDAFLKNLTSGRTWMRKINIPSTHENVAAVLVFPSDLKGREGEILNELHVFLDGEVIIEKWQAPKNSPLAVLRNEMVSSLEIQKVRMRHRRVGVEFRMSVPGGDERFAVKLFDFAEEYLRIRVVAHPFF